MLNIKKYVGKKYHDRDIKIDPIDQSMGVTRLGISPGLGNNSNLLSKLKEESEMQAELDKRTREHQAMAPDSLQKNATKENSSSFRQ